MGAVRTLAVQRSSALCQKIKKTHVAKFLKDGGVGEGKLLSRSFLPPQKTYKLFLNQIFSHIDSAGGEDDDTFDNVLHIGVDSEKGETDKYYT